MFMDSIKALGVAHHVGGKIQLLEDQVAKIAKWEAPSDQSGVRAFLGTMVITRRWIRNFVETARPLSRVYEGKTYNLWIFNVLK